MDTRRDLAYMLCGAVLGALISLLLGAFQTQGKAIAVIFALVLLVGTFGLVAMRLIGPLHLILAKTDGFRLEGDWVGFFSYQKEDTEIAVNEAVTIRQRGRHVVGESRSTSMSPGFPSPLASYSFSAAMRSDGVIEGRWRSIESGQRYYGSFLARARRDGRAILGVWLGVDESHVRHGEFRWSR